MWVHVCVCAYMHVCACMYVCACVHAHVCILQAHIWVQVCKPEKNVTVFCPFTLYLIPREIGSLGETGARQAASKFHESPALAPSPITLGLQVRGTRHVDTSAGDSNSDPHSYITSTRTHSAISPVSTGH